VEVLINALKVADMDENSFYSLLVELLIAHTEEAEEENEQLETLLTIMHNHVWRHA